MTAAMLELDSKRLATTKARCALWGAVMSVIEGDDGRPMILITRWALTRSFSDLDEVEQWLDRVGAKR